MLTVRHKNQIFKQFWTVASLGGTTPAETIQVDTLMKVKKFLPMNFQEHWTKKGYHTG